MRRIATRVLLSCSLLVSAGMKSSAVHATLATRLTLYAGTQGGYIFASATGGPWQERDNGLPLGADIAALAAAPGTPGTVYAGTAGFGVYASRDRGASWSAFADLPNQDNTNVRALAVDPRAAATVFAGLDSGNIFKSESDGSWQSLPVPTGSAITALSIIAGSPETIVAGTSDDGLLISRDGGASWQAPDQNVPAGDQVNALAVDTHSAAVIYAATSDGIYQSIDGGASWQPERRGIPPGTDLQAVAVDPRDGADVLAGSADGILYRSHDGGTSWEATPGSADTQINALAFDPARAGEVVLVALASGGVSVFDTADWESWLPPATVIYLGTASVLCLAVETQPILPTDRVPPPARNLATLRYFPQTGHLVAGAFLRFYDRYGGLKVFGLPLTESFVEGGQVVQYFERTRLVLASGGVQVSPLGLWLTAGRRFPIVAPFASAAALYFPATRHSLRGAFLAFWRNHHGGLLFGPPISEPLHEQNGDGTGRTYLVQYFVDARMEYHPELAGTRFTVTLGLLGRQYLRRRGWI